MAIRMIGNDLTTPEQGSDAHATTAARSLSQGRGRKLPLKTTNDRREQNSTRA
jgi:hypothetical protein